VKTACRTLLVHIVDLLILLPVIDVAILCCHTPDKSCMQGTRQVLNDLRALMVT